MKVIKKKLTKARNNTDSDKEYQYKPVNEAEDIDDAPFNHIWIKKINCGKY